MKVRPDDPCKLTDFKVLAFDCFGTLVDWESGMYAQLEPLRSRLPDDHALKYDRKALMRAFDEIERSLLPHQPIYHYPDLLATAYRELHEKLLPALTTSTSTSINAAEIEAEGQSLGASIATWTAFPDTVAALHRLAETYDLAILSNVDEESFAGVVSPPTSAPAGNTGKPTTRTGALHGVPFRAGIYTAGTIGSYKPDHKNFTYLLDHVVRPASASDPPPPSGTAGAATAPQPLHRSVSKSQVLMVAQGIPSDHVPCAELGITSVWISRGDGDGRGGKAGGWQEEGLEEKLKFTWTFDSMAEMADAVQREKR